MNFQDKIKNKGIEFQNKVQGILEKYKLKVQILDKNNKDSRPDFCISNNTKDEIIGECKAIFSDGYRNGCHISTLDEGFLNQKIIDHSDMDLTKIEEVLKKAQSQLEQLIMDHPKHYDHHPFIIFLDLDFFADDFNFIPKNLFGLEKVSAIAKIERDIERNEKLQKWSSGEIKRLINQKIKEKIPPESVRFKVLINTDAKNKLKTNDFLRNPIIIK